MLKKTLSLGFVIVICLCATLDTFAQITPIETIGGGMNMRIRDRTTAISIPYEPYFNIEASMMNIELFNGERPEGFYRYNLEQEVLEKSNSDETIEAGQIKSFRILNGDGTVAQTFVNIKTLWPKSEYLGFFEQVDENFTVVVKHYLEQKAADYDPTLNMGNPYDRVEKEIEVYYRVIDKWFLAPDSRKKFIAALSEFQSTSDLKKFMKKNKLKVANPKDIAKVIDFVTNN